MSLPKGSIGSQDSTSTSYEEGIRMVEKALDSRRHSQSAQGSTIPAFQPLSFGSDSSAPSSSNAAVVATSDTKEPAALKKSKGKGHPTPATPTDSNNAASINIPPPASSNGPADPAQIKATKKQKREEKKSKNDAYWNEVKAGKRPDPRGDKADKPVPTASKDSAKKDATDKKESIQNSKSKSASSNASGESSLRSSSSSAISTSTKASSGDIDDASKKIKTGKVTQSRIQYDDPKKRERVKKKQIISLTETPRPLTLFRHLPQMEAYKGTVSDSILLQHTHIPANFFSMGLKMANKSIQGSNARCLAMIDEWIEFIHDFNTTTSLSDVRNFLREVEDRMKPIIQFIVDCRPMTIGMGNIINFLKSKISDEYNNTQSTTVDAARTYLIDSLKDFRNTHIIEADKSIAAKVASKIEDNDVILTFSRSYVVVQSLKYAKEEGKRFKVIVVDSAPRFEGKRTLEELVAAEVECEYVLVTAISYVMSDVNKVLVGAAALMGNGQVYSRAGTSVVCLMASQYSVPVLVACESYKFCERVQLDSICLNELDDPDIIASTTGDPLLKGWKSKPLLKMLNLVYDLTPTEFITMVITEHGPVPPSSVPAVIREFHSSITI